MCSPSRRDRTTYPIAREVVWRAAGSAPGEDLRLTAASAVKVAQYGEQFDASGALRGLVRGEKGIAGKLVFEPVSKTADQALALHTAAVSLALCSATADVQ